MQNLSGATNGFAFHNPDHLCYSVMIQTVKQSTLKQLIENTGTNCRGNGLSKSISLGAMRYFGSP